MYQIRSKLFILIIFTAFSNLYAALHICYSSYRELNTCTFKNLHYNKTHFAFDVIILNNSFRVDFLNSSIPKLGSNAICKSSYIFMDDNNVQELDLANTKIEEVHSDAFVSCVDLKVLILRNNEIEMLEDGVLNRNRNLEKIDLTNNLIKELRSQVFADLDKLKQLLLGGNHLKIFAPALIRTISNLEVLRLDSNDLFDLNVEKIYEYAPKLKLVAFNNNQIRCGRVKDIMGTFKLDLIDNRYTGEVIERIEPTESVESIICLPDISWAAIHYIYVYTIITEL